MGFRPGPKKGMHPINPQKEPLHTRAQHRIFRQIGCVSYIRCGSNQDLIRIALILPVFWLQARPDCGGEPCAILGPPDGCGGPFQFLEPYHEYHKRQTMLIGP
jgi:hypothetical protein